MNKIILLSLLMICSQAFANKVATQGDNISAAKINSSVLQIGSIQQSVLSQAKFQILNGDCWVRMEGQSIAGSDLANFETSMATLPDTTTTGVFLRQAKADRTLGTYEADALEDHRHDQLQSGASGAPIPSTTALVSTRNVYLNTAGFGTPGVSTDTANVADETRPKNIAVNFFIKINKECNFN